MLMLVSPEIVKARLKIDNDVDDGNLEFVIAAASKSIITYIGDNVARISDSAGDILTDTSEVAIDIPEDLQMAVCMLVGIWVRDPDGKNMDQWQQGYLPFAVTSFIYTEWHEPSMSRTTDTNQRHGWDDNGCR